MQGFRENFQQHRMNLIIITILLITIIASIISYSLLIESFKFFRQQFVANDLETKTQLQTAITFQQQENSSLTGRLDSLQKWLDVTSSDELRIDFIRETASKANILLKAYDIESEKKNDDEVIKSFNLFLVGEYHSLATFFSEIEHSPIPFYLKSATLKVNNSNTLQLDCQAIIISVTKRKL